MSPVYPVPPIPLLCSLIPVNQNVHIQHLAHNFSRTHKDQGGFIVGMGGQKNIYSFFHVALCYPLLLNCHCSSLLGQNFMPPYLNEQFAHVTVSSHHHRLAVFCAVTSDSLTSLCLLQFGYEDVPFCSHSFQTSVAQLL